MPVILKCNEPIAAFQTYEAATQRVIDCVTRSTKPSYHFIYPWSLVVMVALNHDVAGPSSPPGKDWPRDAASSGANHHPNLTRAGSAHEGKDNGGKASLGMPLSVASAEALDNSPAEEPPHRQRSGLLKILRQAITWTPPRCRFDLKNPPPFTITLNILYGFVSTGAYASRPR